MTCRYFFACSSVGLGAAALLSGAATHPKTGGLPDLPHFAPKAKRVADSNGTTVHLQKSPVKPSCDAATVYAAAEGLRPFR